MKFEWEIKAQFAKACPFCGSDDLKTETEEHFYSCPNTTCTYIECNNCGASIFGNPVMGQDKKFVKDYRTAYDIVLKMWNRRS